MSREPSTEVVGSIVNTHRQSQEYLYNTNATPGIADVADRSSSKHSVRALSTDRMTSNTSARRLSSSGGSRTDDGMRKSVQSLRSATRSLNSTARETEDGLYKAKAFLQTVPTFPCTCLYDHLMEVIRTVLEDDPVNPLDSFEHLSRDLKKKRFRDRDPNALVDVKAVSAAARQSQTLRYLFSTQNYMFGGGLDMPEEVNLIPPNILRDMFFFEQIGTVLPRQECQILQLSIKQLMARMHLFNVRFWGKVFGVQKDYFVVEAEQADDDEFDDVLNFDTGDDTTVTDEKLDRLSEPPGDGEEEPEPSDPVVHFKLPPEAPIEMYGSGVNRKVYFITNTPGGCWVKLPHATPKQIFVARRIRKFFTGDLNHPVVTYPPFPGCERNYLRAQLSRISAGTQISPVGFYQLGDEEDEDEDDEEADADRLVENVEFEPVPVGELAAPDLAGWNHHTQYILPQGRCSWWRPPVAGEKSDDEEEEEVEDEESGAVEPEKGPPLLTPLSEDASMSGAPAWAVRLSSTLTVAHTVCGVRSLLWPGAVAFSDGRHFQNIYLGWGHKALVSGFSPPAPPGRDVCYPPLSETNHAAEPTAAVEAAYRESQKAAEEDQQDEEDMEEEDELDEYADEDDDEDDEED